MQLTQQTDYALRILMYAAAHPERLVNITEIAELYGISRSHLTKSVANLASSQYLESIRGNKGGIRLNKPASEINIGEIIRRFEPLAIVDCMSKTRSCVITPNCKLKHVFIRSNRRLPENLRSIYPRRHAQPYAHPAAESLTAN